MAALEQDIILDDIGFDNASAEMKQLKTRTVELKNRLHTMYQEMTEALKTYAGDELNLTGEKVIIKPIDDLIIVIDHISATLDQIIATGYYKDVFIKYEQLNQNINS